MAINSDDGSSIPASTVDELLAAGRHDDAARAALEGGLHARAADLYEKLWDFRGALEASRAGADLPRALRYALELGDTVATAELLATMTPHAPRSRPGSMRGPRICTRSYGISAAP